MGADSSTLQSIESLNSTLEDIEKKLFVIEDVHLHHDRTISHDETVIISGKKIVCRSGVKLLCGPVLGLVGNDFARVLVEVDQNSDVSLNVFQCDEQLQSTRFAFSVSFPAKKESPGSFKIANLQPGTNYTVYIGGISPNEAVTNYVSFQTMPMEATAIRVLLLNNGRVDRLTPGESNLWNEVENRVLAPQACPPGYFNPTAIEDVYTTPYLPQSPTDTTDPNRPPPVHLLCHHGNLISIESTLRTKAMEMLDLLIREDSNYEDWQALLCQLEAEVKQAYRSALTSPSLQKTLRRCGNVFLVGPEEAGLITTALLALNLPEKLAPRHYVRDAGERQPREVSRAATPQRGAGAGGDGQDTDEGQSDAESTRGASSRSGSTKPTTPGSKRGAAKTAKPKKGKKAKPIETVETAVDDQRKTMIPVAGGSEDVQADIDLTPVVGSALRRFYDGEQQTLKARGIVQENLRRLLAGVLVRALRRISRSYLRQLWDDDYPTLAAEDEEKEIFFRAMLQLQKVLQVKTHMRAILESSRLRLGKEFGADNKALEHLTNKSTALAEEITSLEEELREAAVRSGELSVTATAQPNGVCVQLGALCLVLVESTWGWLGRDDQLLFPMVTEIEIHEQIQSQLELLLMPPPPRLPDHEDDEPAPSEPHRTTTATATVAAMGSAIVGEDAGLVESAPTTARTKELVPVPVKAVLCLSTCPLLPHTAALESTELAGLKTNAGRVGTYRNFNPDGTPAFTFSVLDIRRILTAMAKWQQEAPDRAVLLAGPAGLSVDSASGYCAPYVVTAAGKEITCDAQFDDPANVMLDIWNRDRSRLQQILVGDLSRVSRANMNHFQNLALVHAQAEGQDVFSANATVTDRATQFKSYYDRSTQCVRRCFWDVCFAPQLPPIASDTSFTGVKAAPPAAFVTDCVTEGRRGTITLSLGPVVGGVTPTTANVLIQTTETGPLELLCIDQITGAEFVCSRLANAHRPCVFQFEHLLPNHAYDLVLLDTVGGSSSTGGVLWGSFTTLRANPPLLAHAMSGAAHDGAVVHALRTATGGGGGSPPPGPGGGTSTAGYTEAGAEHGAHHLGNSATNAIRLLLLGASKPSWRNKFTPVVTSADAGTTTKGAKAVRAANVSTGSAALDRLHLQRGVALCQEVAGCLAQGWNGVDLVIHCGYAVDYGLTIDSVLNLLTQAETMQGLHYGSTAHHSFAVSSNNLPPVSSAGAGSGSYSTLFQSTPRADSDYGAAAHALLLQAFDQLRTAYLHHWGATPHTSNLLAHGNHYFLASPLFDLLSIFHATSLRDLRRDLSPFAAHHLMTFLTQLQLEYQTQVSCPVHSIVVQNQHSADIMVQSATSPYLRLLDGGAVAVFELQPNFAYQLDTMQRVGDQLIPEDQHRALQTLLFPNFGADGTEQPSPLRAIPSSSVHTLVLLSPIPLVLESEQQSEYSQLTGQQKGLRYQHREVMYLLDLLALWLEHSPLQREVVIVTGGVPTSFITTIDVDSSKVRFKRPGHGAGSRATSPPAMNLQEGSLMSSTSQPNVLGAALDTAPHSPSHHSQARHHHHQHVRIKQMCVGTLVGIHENATYQASGSLLSPHGRRFAFTHRTCEYGTGAEAMSPGVNLSNMHSHTATRSPTATNSATVEYFPQVGLLEIPTIELRLRLQQQASQHAHHLPEASAVEPPHPGAPASPTSPRMMAILGHTDPRVTEAVHHKQATVRFLDETALKAAFSHGWPLSILKDSHNGPIGGAGGAVSVAGSLASQLHLGSNHLRSIVKQSRLRATPALSSLAEEALRLLPADTTPPLRPIPSVPTTSATNKGAAQAKSSAAAALPLLLPTEPFIAEIKRALDIICTRERTAFEECHKLFTRQDHFPLPVAGGINVERCLLAASAQVISRMQPATRAVCKVPSSFVVRLVWEHYERQATKLVKHTDAPGAAAAPGIKTHEAGQALLAEFVTANMVGDADYFIRMLRTCLELQLVVEYQAYSKGMLDGAER